ncbi:MAG: bifunctional hydroxymethylpyrimidine kinase/phosphomethylpyrimidine kinase [Candidatus Omnitrophica bacterium]|nr:bifunctional hydroxymethylpyrimidine kinase/phosphomethylpyrimidine kinase [Candidatus Omnitrophota bacterium]
MSIIVLGTVALDTVKTPFGKRELMLGGSAVHFSMSARLFTKVSLVAVVGKDFPQKHIKFLKEKSIDVSSVVCEDGPCFKWEGEYVGDLNSANTLHTELGVLAAFRPKLTLEQKKIKYVFLANLDPEIQMHVLENMGKPSLVGLDSMNFWIHHKRAELISLLKYVDIYVANDQEARSLSQETHLIKAAKALHAMGPKMILIKKGEHGVLFYSDKFILSLPAYPTEKVIDPTGAGDTFAGGFMGYLAKAKKIDQLSLKRALAYGTVAASFNVEGFGVEKTSKLNFKDLEGRLGQFKECFHF